MFDIGPLELLLVFVVALLVIGPERLPSAVKTTSLWISRFRRSFNKIKAEVEKELNADEIRRQIHNESILADVEEAKKKAKSFSDEVKSAAAGRNTKALTDSKDSGSGTSSPGDSTATDSKDSQAAARKSSDEESSIARELGQAVSYVNDISREVKTSGEELQAGFNNKSSGNSGKSTDQQAPSTAPEKSGTAKSK